MEDWLQQFREKHQEDWLVQPIPALNNQSPTAASKSAAGRALLDQLLDEYERAAIHLSAMDDVNPEMGGHGMSMDANPDRAWAYSRLGITTVMESTPSGSAREVPAISGSSSCAFALGSSVALTRLDTISLNGQSGKVVGPPSEGRLPVRLQGGKTMRIRIRHLREYDPYDESALATGDGPPAAPNPQNKSQSSRGAQYDKTVSYVVARVDFERLPRWPADGCERAALAFRSGHDEIRKHVEHPNKCARQRAFERVAGGWASSKPLREISDEGLWLLALPYMEQTAAAEETFDVRAALDHLYTRQEDPEVAALLDRATGKRQFKLGTARGRFPGLRMLLACLAKKRLATDHSLEVLFGEAAHVRRLMLEVGNLFADRPPAGSPTYAEWQDVLEEEFALLPGCCANCSAEGAHLRLLRCGSCKEAEYCSTVCQKAHWPLHKPACRRATGKGVTSADAAASAAEKALREQVLARESAAQMAQLDAKEARWEDEAFRAYESGAWDSQPSAAHNCDGKPYAADVGEFAYAIVGRCAQLVGLLPRVQHLRPMTGTPLGLPNNVENWYVLQTEAGAYIVLPHEPLFGDSGGGNFAGVAFAGTYVAEEGNADDVAWVAVARPRGATGRRTRDSAFTRTCAWLRAAKERATAVTHGLFKRGTPECLGHSVLTHHTMGCAMHSVGPPTSSAVAHARSRLLARQQLRAASEVLEGPPPSSDALVRAEARLLSVLDLACRLPAEVRDQPVVTRAATLLARVTGHRPSTAAVAVAMLERVASLGGWDTSHRAQIDDALAGIRANVRTSAASAGAAPAPSAEETPALRQCKACGACKPRAAYSTNQWKQGKRRCRGCQEGGVTTTVAQRADAQYDAEEEAAFAALHSKRVAEESAWVETELERRNANARADDECPICFDAKAAADKCALHGNGQHWVCRGCLAEMMAVSRDATGIPCPHCRQECSFAAVRGLLR